MLKTERNTPAMERRVLRAFKRWHAPHLLHPRRQQRRITAHFEHGQWWIIDSDTGANWSVVDAAGGRAVDGFDFELVTEGEGH